MAEEENHLLQFVDFRFQILPWYEYLVYVSAAVFCVCFAGLMSGLTLGLLSFEPMTLEIMIQTGKPAQRKRAKKIYRLVKHHHWLLTTLLISNALAMEALPIFLDTLVPATVAIIVSVTCILLFGEVIPQALCSRYGLIIGAYSYYLVAFLMIITFPISYPISKLLDCILGKTHLTFYGRDQLGSLVALHGEGISAADSMSKPLSKDEITVIRGALEMSNKTVGAIMTKLENVYMLPLDSVLDMTTLEEIQTKGHSRIPIYQDERTNLVGLLLVKSLITVNPNDQAPLETMNFRTFPLVEADMNVWDMLNVFQEGKSHMALVISCTQDREPKIKTIVHRSDSSSMSDEVSEDEKPDPPAITIEDAKKFANTSSERIKNLRTSQMNNILPSPEAKIFNDFQEFKLYKQYYKKKMVGGEILGVVTLEDVIEELIQEEIIDETDVFVDLNTRLRVADAYRRISQCTSSSGKRKLKQTKSELEKILEDRVSAIENSGFARPYGERDSNTTNNDAMMGQMDQNIELPDLPQEVIEIREKRSGGIRIPPMKEILKRKMTGDRKKKDGDRQLLLKNKT